MFFKLYVKHLVTAFYCYCLVVIVTIIIIIDIIINRVALLYSLGG